MVCILRWWKNAGIHSITVSPKGKSFSQNITTPNHSQPEQTNSFQMFEHCDHHASSVSGYLAGLQSRYYGKYWDMAYFRLLNTKRVCGRSAQTTDISSPRACKYWSFYLPPFFSRQGAATVADLDAGNAHICFPTFTGGESYGPVLK